MKAEYIYYAGNNYLKLELQDDYKVQMLLSRKLQGLLEFEKNSINGEIRYLYLISGKQSIRSRYSLRPFTREVYGRFIESIFALAKQLEQYLLDIRDVVFDPDFIYQDMETKEISFVYMPGYAKNLSENLLDFYLFLLEHMDSEDEDFVKEVYLTYDKIDEAGELFHINMLALPNRIEENSSETEVQVIQSLPVYEESAEVEEVAEEPGNSYLWLLILLDGIVFYFLWNQFSVSDIRFLVGVVVVLSVNAVVFLVQKHKNKNSAIESRQSQPPIDSVQQYVEAMSPEEYGKTMFLDPTGIPDEKRLYGMGKGNAYVLSLEKTPYTIGKEKDFVDGILSHESVSRMHARITEEENKLYLEDLNSTNGTFKNGVRLIPLEKVELEAGDEVKFGVLRFTYR